MTKLANATRAQRIGWWRGEGGGVTRRRAWPERV
jgi:hypothetical protein